jgi:hypothetical protein
MSKFDREPPRADDEYGSEDDDEFDYSDNEYLAEYLSNSSEDEEEEDEHTGRLLIEDAIPLVKAEVAIGPASSRRGPTPSSQGSSKNGVSMGSTQKPSQPTRNNNSSPTSMSSTQRPPVTQQTVGDKSLSPTTQQATAHRSGTSDRTIGSDRAAPTTNTPVIPPAQSPRPREPPAAAPNIAMASSHKNNGSMKDVVKKMSGVDKTIHTAKLTVAFTGSLNSLAKSHRETKFGDKKDTEFVISGDRAMAVFAPNIHTDLNNNIANADWNNVDYTHMVILGITLESFENTLAKPVCINWSNNSELNVTPKPNLDDTRVLAILPSKKSQVNVNLSLYDRSSIVSSFIFEKFGNYTMEDVFKNDVVLEKDPVTGDLTSGGLKTDSQVNRMAKANRSTLGVQPLREDNGTTYYTIEDLIKILKQTERKIFSNIQKTDIKNSGVKLHISTLLGEQWDSMSYVNGSDTSTQDDPGLVYGVLKITYVFPRKSKHEPKRNTQDPLLQLLDRLKA